MAQRMSSEKLTEEVRELCEGIAELMGREEVRLTMAETFTVSTMMAQVKATLALVVAVQELKETIRMKP